MSIKDRGKKYAEFLDFLRKEYIAKYGKESEGLADTMLKRKAAEKVDEMMKVIPFPEKNITDWTKERPKTGPKADVKKFPTKNKPAAQTYSSDFLDLLEEMEKLGQPYKDTSVSDFMSDYFDMPKKSKTPATDKMQKMLGDVKLYGDETFDELQIIKDTGEHPRDKKANGGRIGYAEGMSAEEAVAARLPPNYKFLEDADLKRSPEGIVMEGYQDTTTLDMLRDALKGAPKTPSVVEYDDGTLYYPEFDEYYKEDGKQVEGPAFWAKPIPKLFEVPKHSERKSIDLANGGRIGFKFGTKKRGDKIKSIIEEVNKKLKTKTTGGEVKLTVDIPESPKAELQRMFDEFNKRFKKKTTPDTKDLEKARGKYGSGEDLYKILKSEGITMDKAVKEAIDDMPRLSGDAKYDADAVADVMYERLGIDPDTLDQYHLLDVYDNAYQQLVKQKRKSMYQTAAEDSLKKMDPKAETYAKELEYDVQEKISEPGYRGVVTEASDLDDTLKIVESQKSEATKLREKYPGISEALLDKLVKDGNPQRKAEVLAALDEVLTMMDKGMDKDEIIGVLKNTTRTKNQEGGLNTLTDKFNKVGDFVNKYSGMDSLFKLVEYLNTLGTPKGPFRNPFGPKLIKPIDLKKIKRRKKEKSEGLDYLQGF